MFLYIFYVLLFTIFVLLGGLKIWECTYDLVEYLEENSEVVNFHNLKALDLGCGAGILGIYAFLKGAFVTFQDYVSEYTYELYI